MGEAVAPSWSFFNPVHVECGKLEDLPRHITGFSHVLLVTSKGWTRRGLTERVTSLLNGMKITVFDQVQPNPDIDELDDAKAALKLTGIDAVLAIGGGSVLDAGKVLAVTLNDALERPLEQVFRRGVSHSWAGRLPMFAVPTTAGTGSEVTPFATVWDRTHYMKYSLSGPHVYPDVAFLDPSLTLTLPADDTLYPGLDAISHALESLWNRHCTPISGAFSMRSLSLMQDALPIALKSPEDIASRRLVQEASLLAGLAISQTRTAVAHAISYPLTSRLGVPHGLACSFTLPRLLESNLPHLVSLGYEEGVLRKTLQFLDSLDLGKRLQNYASAERVLELQSQMSTKGRSDNYLSPSPLDLESLLTNSLTR